MSIFWEKLKAFFREVGRTFSGLEWIVVGLIVVVLSGFLVINYRVRHQNDKNSNQTPELVLHPSIGDALAPDTPNLHNNANVSAPALTSNNGSAPDSKFKVAPKTGVDLNDPIVYQSARVSRPTIK